MKNTRCNHPPRRARRRPGTLTGAAAAAAGEHEYRFVFEDFHDIPVVVHTDELWRIVDLKFFGSRFGTPQVERRAVALCVRHRGPSGTRRGTRL